MISVTCVATKGHIDAQFLECHLWLCWYLRVILLLGPCWLQWPELTFAVMTPSEPRLLLRVMSSYNNQCLCQCPYIGFSNHWEPSRCPRSGQPIETMLVSENHAATWVILIWVVYVGTQGHDDIGFQAVAKGHVCVCGPNATCVSGDIHDSCYYQGPCRDLKPGQLPETILVS